MGFSSSYLNCKLGGASDSKSRKIRLFSPIASNGQFNNYCFYIKVPKASKGIEIAVLSESEFNGEMNYLKVTHLVSGGH